MATGVFPTLLLVGGMLAAVTIAGLFLRRSPRSAFVVWVLVLFFVPVWVGANAGIFWSAITVVTIAMLIINGRGVPFHIADAWMAAFLVLTVGLYALGGVELGAMVTSTLEWVLPYVWGRVVLSRVSPEWVVSAIASVAVAAASLALVEALTGVNIFVGIPGSAVLREAWSPLQIRAGIVRTEGAFGHSIALGAALAMSSAFVVAARWHLAIKTAGILVVTAATVLTFSRAGLATLVLTLALSVFLLPSASRSLRVVVVSAGTLGALVVVPFLSDIFAEAGKEASGSANYRTDLWTLIGQVQLFGNPGDWTSLVSGDYYLGYFSRSIDNALVLALLRYGYVPTILFALAILCAVWTAVRHETRNPASLAVAGQIPSLVVVALITQYGMLLWFCVGLAIAWGALKRGHPEQTGAPMADRSFDRVDSRGYFIG